MMFKASSKGYPNADLKLLNLTFRVLSSGDVFASEEYMTGKFVALTQGWAEQETALSLWTRFLHDLRHIENQQSVHQNEVKILFRAFRHILRAHYGDQAFATILEGIQR